MAKRKTIAKGDLAAMAAAAQDMAIDISHAADAVTIMQDDLGSAFFAVKFNQLAEAANKMNRMLLALIELRECKAELEAQLRARPQSPPEGN